MGKLTYDSHLTVEFDDRLLAHLQVVIGMKLRRGESFYFSWRDDPKAGDGRSTIWIQDSVPLYYRYYGGKPPALNRLWIEALLATANTATGLQIVREPTGGAHATEGDL
jgi:hypothetical protein